MLFRSGDSVVLEVEDTGIGIPVERHDSIFEEFVQAENSDARRFGGSGLGLTIVHRLVTLMNGSISLRSASGRGSCFRVVLPLAHVDGAGATRRRQPSSAEMPAGSIGPPTDHAVLLVEDSPANRAVALALLEREGYEVVVAENGREALERAAERPFALILMDLAMPEMDGLEATRRIRAESGPNRRSPIVAMTANAFAEDRERCLAAGMDDFSTKPVDIPTFRERVREWCEDISEHTGAFSMLTTRTTDTVVDWRVLDKMAKEMSWEVIPELVGAFTNEVRERTPTLAEHLLNGDLADVAIEAHAIKGSAGSFGAIRLQALAREIERAAKSGDLQSARVAAEPLEVVTAQTLAGFQHVLAQQS